MLGFVSVEARCPLEANELAVPSDSDRMIVLNEELVNTFSVEMREMYIEARRRQHMFDDHYDAFDAFKKTVVGSDWLEQEEEKISREMRKCTELTSQISTALNNLNFDYARHSQGYFEDWEDVDNEQDAEEIRDTVGDLSRHCMPHSQLKFILQSLRTAQGRIYKEISEVHLKAGLEHERDTVQLQAVIQQVTGALDL